MPNNMCILKGFPTTLARSTSSFPFGIWFANAEHALCRRRRQRHDTYSTGNGTYTAAAAQTTAGLQKWVFNRATEPGSSPTRCKRA